MKAGVFMLFSYYSDTGFIVNTTDGALFYIYLVNPQAIISLTTYSRNPRGDTINAKTCLRPVFTPYSDLSILFITQFRTLAGSTCGRYSIASFIEKQNRATITVFWFEESYSDVVIIELFTFINSCRLKGRVKLRCRTSCLPSGMPLARFVTLFRKNYKKQ